jgi:hypothetical protein
VADTRDILLVEGVLLPNDTLAILVNHWPSRSGGEAKTAPKRIEAAKTNRQIIDKILQQQPNTKIIVMGDLNDDPDDASVVKHLVTTDKIIEGSTKQLYNPWSKLHKKGLGTLTHNDKWNLFDQIIISQNWLKDERSAKWVFQSAQIFDGDFLKNSFGKYKGYPYRSYSGKKWIKGYSDHFPTYIILEKNN